MMFNHASNAVSAKARTMYGNRLSEKTFVTYAKKSQKKEQMLFKIL
ncbi:MAG: hypothetical protein PUC88_06640 [Clostridia bacterium]|nr:hypothetical protein [Clostridia bacterium]